MDTNIQTLSYNSFFFSLNFRNPITMHHIFDSVISHRYSVDWLYNAFDCLNNIGVLGYLHLSLPWQEDWCWNKYWCNWCSKYWRTRNTNDIENFPFCWSCEHEYPSLFIIYFECIVYYYSIFLVHIVVCYLTLSQTSLLGFLVSRKS